MDPKNPGLLEHTLIQGSLPYQRKVCFQKKRNSFGCLPLDTMADSPVFYDIILPTITYISRNYLVVPLILVPEIRPDSSTIKNEQRHTREWTWKPSYFQKPL